MMKRRKKLKRPSCNWSPDQEVKMKNGIEVIIFEVDHDSNLITGLCKSGNEGSKEPAGWQIDGVCIFPPESLRERVTAEELELEIPQPKVYVLRTVNGQFEVIEEGSCLKEVYDNWITSRTISVIELEPCSEICVKKLEELFNNEEEEEEEKEEEF